MVYFLFGKLCYITYIYTQNHRMLHWTKRTLYKRKSQGKLEFQWLIGLSVNFKQWCFSFLYYIYAETVYSKTGAGKALDYALEPSIYTLRNSLLDDYTFSTK